MLRHLVLIGRVTSFLGICLAATTVAAQQPQAPARAPQAPPRSPYQEAGQLPARIMSFTADPSAIKPGESVTLKWAVENPRTTTIDPAIGRAVPRGELRVTPAATTTYTLTVTGVNGTLTRTVTVTVAGTQPVAANTESVPMAARPVPLVLTSRAGLLLLKLETSTRAALPVPVVLLHMPRPWPLVSVRRVVVVLPAFVFSKYPACPTRALAFTA